MFTYFWEKEKGVERVGEGQRKRETEDPKGAPRWQQRARCGAQTHEPWDYDLSRNMMLNWLSHPGTPGMSNFYDVVWKWKKHIFDKKKKMMQINRNKATSVQQVRRPWDLSRSHLQLLTSICRCILKAPLLYPVMTISLSILAVVQVVLLCV